MLSYSRRNLYEILIPRLRLEKDIREGIPRLSISYESDEGWSTGLVPKTTFILHPGRFLLSSEFKGPEGNDLARRVLMTGAKVNSIRVHNGQSETKHWIIRCLSGPSRSPRSMDPSRKQDYLGHPLTSRLRVSKIRAAICQSSLRTVNTGSDFFPISFLLATILIQIPTAAEFSYTFFFQSKMALIPSAGFLDRKDNHSLPSWSQL